MPRPRTTTPANDGLMAVNVRIPIADHRLLRALCGLAGEKAPQIVAEAVRLLAESKGVRVPG